jgi:hypothetical protein
MSNDISIISGMISTIGLANMMCPYSTIESDSVGAFRGKMVGVMITANLTVMFWMVFLTAFDPAVPGLGPHLCMRTMAGEMVGVCVIANLAKVTAMIFFTLTDKAHIAYQNKQVLLDGKSIKSTNKRLYRI